MRLTDLITEDHGFLSRLDDTRWSRVETIAAADGISFLCPKCLAENGMKRPGVHSVICWRPCVPLSTPPGPGRWNFLGTGFADLTLRAGSSSILLTSGCNAHFFIENGAIRMC